MSNVWNLVVALAILTLFFGLIIEYFSLASPQHAKLVEKLNILAALVLATDLIVAFTLTGQKTLFLKRYWLDILLLIPFVLALKAGALLRELPLLRNINLLHGTEKTLSIALKTTPLEKTILTAERIVKDASTLKDTLTIIRRLK